jgi:hypothetical protein
MRLGARSVVEAVAEAVRHEPLAAALSQLQAEDEHEGRRAAAGILRVLRGVKKRQDEASSERKAVDAEWTESDDEGEEAVGAGNDADGEQEETEEQEEGSHSSEDAVAHLLSAFAPRVESRHALRAVADLFNNREATRDALLAIVRDFRGRGRYNEAQEAGARAMLISQWRSLLTEQLLPANVGWFAALFVHELLSHSAAAAPSTAPRREQWLQRRLHAQPSLSSVAMTEPQDLSALFVAGDEECFMHMLLAARDAPLFLLAASRALVAALLDLSTPPHREASEAALWERSYAARIALLCAAARFLGLVTFSPHYDLSARAAAAAARSAGKASPDSGRPSVDHPLTTTLEDEARRLDATAPLLDVNAHLERALEQQSLALTVPWVTHFLAPMRWDAVSPLTRYFSTTRFLLAHVLRHLVARTGDATTLGVRPQAPLRAARVVLDEFLSASASWWPLVPPLHPQHCLLAEQPQAQQSLLVGAVSRVPQLTRSPSGANDDPWLSMSPSRPTPAANGPAFFGRYALAVDTLARLPASLAVTLASRFADEVWMTLVAGAGGATAATASASASLRPIRTVRPLSVAAAPPAPAGPTPEDAASGARRQLQRELFRQNPLLARKANLIVESVSKNAVASLLGVRIERAAAAAVDSLRECARHAAEAGEPAREADAIEALSVEWGALEPHALRELNAALQPDLQSYVSARVSAALRALADPETPDAVVAQIETLATLRATELAASGAARVARRQLQLKVSAELPRIVREARVALRAANDEEPERRDERAPDPALSVAPAGPAAQAAPASAPASASVPSAQAPPQQTVALFKAAESALLSLRGSDGRPEAEQLWWQSLNDSLASITHVVAQGEESEVVLRSAVDLCAYVAHELARRGVNHALPRTRALLAHLPAELRAAFCAKFLSELSMQERSAASAARVAAVAAALTDEEGKRVENGSGDGVSVGDWERSLELLLAAARGAGPELYDFAWAVLLAFVDATRRSGRPLLAVLLVAQALACTPPADAALAKQAESALLHAAAASQSAAE